MLWTEPRIRIINYYGETCKLYSPEATVCIHNFCIKHGDNGADFDEPFDFDNYDPNLFVSILRDDGGKKNATCTVFKQ